MDEQTRRRRVAGWLEVLAVYFRNDLAHGHFFRTALDNWAMYDRDGPFLSRTGGPKFFNKPKSNDERLKLMDFTSDAALAVMEGPVANGKLMVDHAVPVSVIHTFLRRSQRREAADIEEILRGTYRLGVLTREEDRDPRLAKSSMPDGWRPGTDCPFARYNRAGIGGRAAAPADGRSNLAAPPRSLPASAP